MRGKQRKRLIQEVIALLAILILGCRTITYAETTENLKSNDKNAETVQSGDLANSWRYANGVKIQLCDPVQSERAISVFSMRPDEAASRGIDVSYHQGTINWSRVKPNIDFAILRCGYGDNITSQDDKQWQANVSACEQLGIPYGVYLYSYAVDTAGARREAQHALRLLEGHRPTLPVFYDLEDTSISNKCSNVQILEHAKIFCGALQNAGYTPGVYANKYWWTTHLTSSVYNQWERWVAQYNTTCTYSGSYNYWQYTDAGSVPGISGNVDMNYSKLTFGSTPVNPGGQEEIEYYPACSSFHTSLVDALKSIGVDSSYANRAQIAGLNGISDYSGSVAQNNHMLSLLKQGKLIKSKRTKPNEIRGNEMSSGYDRVLPDGDYIIASAANPQYFLDIEGAAWPAVNETNVSLYNWSGDLDTFDTWTIRYSDGFYRISQNGADVSLDVNNADTLQGANVKVYANNNSSAQKWAISRNGRNGYRLQAKCSGYSLDVTDGNISNGTNVRQYSGNDTDAQAWVFIPYKPSQDIPNGRYIILTDLDRTVEVDVPGDTGDVPNEANIQLWKDTAPSRYNSFDITKLSNGYYKIIHAASGKALDMYGGGTALGSNISLHDANGSTAQQWAITNAGGDSFIIWARCSGMVMDVENSKTENGTNISQYTYHGLPNQKWHFVKAEYPVTYDAMGGQETPAGQTKYYKSDLKLSSAVPQKKGYVFKGWNDSKELNGTLYASGSTYTKDEDLKLYAVWEKQGYKITYHLDGGVNADSNPDSYYAEDPYVRLSAPSKEGYVFEGWYFSKDGDEVVTEKTKLQGDVDLYAHWRKDGTPTLSVRWDKKMLIASVSNMDCATGYGFVYGKEAEVTLETPGRQRVAFTSVTADQTFSFDTSGVEEGNFFRGYVTYKSAGKEAVIYADPVTHPEKYKVSFDAAGGECTEASREVVWGEAVGALPEPKKDYFEFIGWYTEDGQKISENQVFSEEMVNLAASWEEKPVSKDFVREDQLPSGARIVEEKYTYTKRNYTESSGSEMSGWIRYDRKRTGWGGQQGPVYSDPSNGERNVWNESYVVSSNHKTIYHYFRYSTGHTASGGSDKPTSKYGTTLYTYDFDEPLTVLGTDGNYSRGYRYYYSGSRYCTVWKRDPFTTQEWVSDNYGTRWYYQDPVYTYYFYKDESKTSSTYPTESDISNVVKWVRYREK